MDFCNCWLRNLLRHLMCVTTMLLSLKTPVNFQTDPDPVTFSPKLWNWSFEGQETTCIWDLLFFITLLSLLLWLVFANMWSNNVGQVKILYTSNLLIANSWHCKSWTTLCADSHLGTLNTSRPDKMAAIFQTTFSEQMHFRKWKYWYID